MVVKVWSRSSHRLSVVSLGISTLLLFQKIGLEKTPRVCVTTVIGVLSCVCDATVVDFQVAGKYVHGTRSELT